LALRTIVDMATTNIMSIQEMVSTCMSMHLDRRAVLDRRKAGVRIILAVLGHGEVLPSSR
jgi:hypothetical protein